MHHQGIKAPAELHDSIRCFWHSTLDAEELRPGFEIVPDGSAEIIFHFGSPCSVLTPQGLQPLPSPFLMGLLNRPVHVHADSQLEIIGIKCLPWRVFDLLGLPAGPDSVRTFAHPLAALQAPLAALVQAGRIAAALALVQQFFLDEQLGPTTDSLLHKAGGAMRQAHGTLPVSQVAAAAHATVRTLERKFKQAAGHTVKHVSGLLRFEQVRNHLWREPAASLAALAPALGYADQAHLSREFKRYSGTTPAAFARKARQRKQAIGDVFVAFVQA